MAYSKDRANRARWSRDQKAQASDNFAAELPTVSKVRAWRIAELRQLATMMEDRPHMASTLAAVRAELAKLEA